MVHAAFFARRVAFSRMSMLVMFWSHARLFAGARFLFLCVVLVFAPCSLLAICCTGSVSLSVFFLAVCLLEFSSCCRVVLAFWGQRLPEVTLGSTQVCFSFRSI